MIMETNNNTQECTLNDLFEIGSPEWWVDAMNSTIDCLIQLHCHDCGAVNDEALYSIRKLQDMFLTIERRERN